MVERIRELGWSGLGSDCPGVYLRLCLSDGTGASLGTALLSGMGAQTAMGVSGGKAGAGGSTGTGF